MCSEEDFYWYHDYRYGNCYRFNGGKVGNSPYNTNNYSVPIKRVKKSGAYNGLRLELYTGDPILDHNFTYTIGYRIAIHNQTVEASLDDGLNVAPGHNTEIALSRTLLKKKPHPYSDCLSKFPKDKEANEMFKLMQEFFKLSDVYNQKTCEKACRQIETIKNCSCADFDLPMPILEAVQAKYPDTWGCYYGDEIICSTDLNSGYENADNCNSKCPLQCDQYIYDYTISSSQYPSPWYSNLIHNGLFNYTLNGNNPQLTKLMVNIYYSNLAYTQITESPKMTPDMLISAIGGNLGLFAGISILTIIEFTELIVYCTIVGFIGIIVRKKV